MGTKQSEAPATPQTQGTNQVQNGFAICFPSPHPLSWSHHSYHFFLEICSMKWRNIDKWVNNILFYMFTRFLP